MTERAVKEPSLDEVFADICSAELPLRDRLASFASALPKHEWGRAFAEVYDNLIHQLDQAKAGAAAPAVNESLPEFLLPDADGHLVSLGSLLGSGPVIISFNRGHWCQFCELELRALAAAHAELAHHGAKIICIMPERLVYLQKARAKTGDSVSYLADVDNGYALSLGLAVWLGDAVRDLYVRSGLDLQNFQGNDMWFAPIPATFLLDSEGLVVLRRVDPDFRTRMDVEDILENLRRLEVSPN
jgi:peroxiredoxin